MFKNLMNSYQSGSLYRLCNSMQYKERLNCAFNYSMKGTEAILSNKTSQRGRINSRCSHSSVVYIEMEQ